MDWCRDVDWGSAPQWAAVAIGLVTAGFTIFGILTARSSYMDDVRTRTFAQARLVYADVSNVRTLEPSGFPEYIDRLPSGYERLNLISKPQEEVFTGRVHGEQLRFTAVEGQTVRLFVVTVHNNSDEIISKVKVTVKSLEGFDALDHVVEFGIIAPNTVRYLRVVTDRVEHGVSHAEVVFRDATGKYWTRDGSEPVERLTSKPS